MPWTKTPQDRKQDAQRYGPEYRRNRAVVRRRSQGRCAGCSHKHTRLQCDHIANVASAGRPDHSVANLQMLCAGPGTCQCHERKTATEGGGFRQPGRTPKDPDPKPRTRW